MQFIFCPVCANKLVEKNIDDRMRQTCPKCGYVHYHNPAPAAAAILVENDKVLLVKRKFEPKVGYWTLPAGFIELDETAQGAAKRETLEETGLTVEILQLHDVLGSCDDLHVNVVLVVYIVKRIAGTVKAGDDALEAEFFPLKDLPENIAFSSHRLALENYIKNGNL